MDTKQTKKIYKIISIILIIIWMLIVFCYSAENGEESTGTSQEVCEKIVDVISAVKKLEPAQEEDLVQKIGPVIRKLAHYSIYLVGGVLAANCCKAFGCSYKQIFGYALLFCIMYAACDELHQYFVPERSARLFDVGVDTFGALTGILIFLGSNRRKKILK